MLFGVFYLRDTPAPTKEVPSSPKNTPPPKEVSPPPPPKIAKSSENVSPSKDLNKIFTIRIISDLSYLIPGETKFFKIKATNESGDEIDPGLIHWKATGGEIDSQGKLIVGSQSKGTFKVTATSPDNMSCWVNYDVLPRLTNIEIVITKEIVMPGQIISLQLVGKDQTNENIDIEGKPVWHTSSGEINLSQKLIVNSPNQIVYITANIQGLEAQATVKIGDYPHESVVQRDYEIIIPDLDPTTSGLPTPNPPENSFEGEVSINLPNIIVKEASRLVALEIDIPYLIILRNSQERVFTVSGIDQFGVYIDPGQIFWSATGGKIDSQGKLIVNAEAEGRFKITATSSHAKISRYNSLNTILMIRISLKIFSFILSKKRFIKDIMSYFIQELCSSEIEINENLLPGSDRDITEILNVLIFDNIKDWIVETVVNIIIDYLDKFISLCFVEDFDPLICSKYYIVLSELESQESLKAIKTVESSFNTSTDNKILAKFRIESYHQRINPGNSIQLYLAKVNQNKERILTKAPIIWKTTCGKISSTGLLVISDLNYIVMVTATIGILEITTRICFRRTYQAKLATLQPSLTVNEMKIFIDIIDCVMEIKDYPKNLDF